MANAPLSPTHEPPPPPPTTVAAAAAADESAVRVAVRARPLIEKEIVEKCRECVAYSCDGRQLVLGKDRRFTFDHVFGPMSGQEDVYLDCVKPLVDSCIAGYNATVLAYGQTGSGKTFTMGCGNSMSLLEEELGILPRAIRHLYEGVEERTNQAEFLVIQTFSSLSLSQVSPISSSTRFQRANQNFPAFCCTPGCVFLVKSSCSVPAPNNNNGCDEGLVSLDLQLSAIEVPLDGNGDASLQSKSIKNTYIYIP
jgi:hypothetical protein